MINENQERISFRQIESYMQILKILDINYPLDFMRGWAVSPDFLLLTFKKILQHLKKKKNVLIFEAGAGVSTILFGYFLKKFFPEGKIVSVEHDYDFYLKSKQEIELHKLDNVELIYAPLVRYKIEEKVWLWYDMEKIRPDKFETCIDVLFIDGPPLNTQEAARYPVIPLMSKFLNSGFLLFLDDAAREDEKKVIEMWLKSGGVYDYEYWDTEKGGFFLKKIDIKVNDPVFFSVCIPTYNRSEFLREAIESVLSQNYKNFELIVYDDGSDQDTFSVIKSFNDERIRFFKGEENRGRPFARNECLKRAKGEWIVWLDDDDIVFPEVLTNYLKSIMKFPEVSIFYHRDVVYMKYDENKKTMEKLDYERFLDFYKKQKEKFFYLSQGSVIPNPVVCVRKELYDRFGYYDAGFKRAQDYEFWTRTVPFVEVKGILKAGVCYRIHGGNISGTMEEVDNSFESLIVRRYLDIVNIDDIFYFLTDKREKFRNFAEQLLCFGDYLNASFYLWISDLKEVAKEVLFSSSQLKDVEKELKFLKLLRKRRSLSACKFAEKYLPLLFQYIAKFHLYMEEGEEEKGVNFLKKAVLISPFYNFSKFKIEESLLEMVKEEVLGRILCEANTIEKRCKANFLKEVLKKN